MSKVVQINSQSHFKSTLASTSYLVAYFTASWCGPCKQISPVFDQLADAESKPGRITFAKIDVDAQKDVAGTYGISAMPTFLILKSNTVIETVRGANASSLRQAVLSAAASAAKGPAKSSASFSGKGQTLGSSTSSSSSRTVSAPSIDFGALAASPASFSQGRGWPSTVVRFSGLYVTSLLSLEPGRAAEESPFAVRTGQGQKMR